jgi:hypothetical protein
LVQFDTAFAVLLFGGEGVPAKVNGTVTTAVMAASIRKLSKKPYEVQQDNNEEKRSMSYLQVTDEFSGARDILHYSDLKESNEGKDLGKTSSTNRWERSDARRNGLERRSVVIDITRETHSGSGDNVAKNSKHRDTAVLDLNITQAIEAGSISILQESEWVKESERCLGANLTLICSQ